MKSGTWFSPKKSIILLVLMTAAGFATTGISAQQPPQGDTGQVLPGQATGQVLHCLVLSRSHSPETDLQDLHRSLEKEFLSTLQQAPGLKTMMVETRFQALPSGEIDTKTLQDLAATGWQVVISLDFREISDRTNLTVRLWDPVLGQLLHSGAKSGTHDLSFYRLIQEMGEENGTLLAADLAALLAPRKSTDGLLTLGGLVLTSPDEGVEVRMDGWISLGILEGGHLEFPLPLARGRSITLTLHKKGHHDRQVTLMPTMPDQVFALPALVPKRWWEAWLAWDPVLPVSASLGLRFFPLPDRLYLELEGGIRDMDDTWTDSTSSTSLFATTGLIDIPARIFTRWGLSTGWYFGEPEDIVRLFVQAGLGVWAGPSASSDGSLVPSNIYLSFPVLGVELNLGTFRAALSLGSEFVLASDQPAMESGNSRLMLPGRLSLGVAW